jgi:DNA processing protein
MTPGRGQASAAACEGCLRRSWLLASLGPALDYCAHDHARLTALLALDDEQLVTALGGTRRAELAARYEHFEAEGMTRQHDVSAVCRHDSLYPPALSARSAPRMLNVAGGARRLDRLLFEPVVAIVGSSRASDYGMEMAASLARGLSAAGVTVTSGLLDGVPAAAHTGALEASGSCVAVIGRGLETSCPPRRRALYERLRQRGCAVSELPNDCAPRRWGPLGAERIVAGLADLTVVIEAEESARDLSTARMAQALGRSVAALPGRVSSPLSRGTHALLHEGASLVRDAQDALELLFELGVSRIEPARRPPLPRVSLEPRLQRILDRIAAGCDTPGKLWPAGVDAELDLMALSELELRGLVARGDGGRYVPRDP